MSSVRVFVRVVFVLFVFACFYLLFVSRAGEVHAVWEVLNPLFAPVFLVTTLFLAGIVFSSERVEFKLLFVILFSVLVHSFFAVVFPVGPVGFQQAVLGVSRRIFDNSVLHGWGGLAPDLVERVYHWFGAENFQSVYSVMFARMFGVDVLWTHLFLVPVVWGVFVPLIAFLIAKMLLRDEKVGLLAGLLSLAFPLLISWGTISVPNSLGYVLFFASLYFCLRYFSLGERRVLYLLVLLVFVSFMAHPISGIMSLVFVFLGFTLRSYDREKVVSVLTARFSLLVSVVVSCVLLPFALIFLQFFSTSYASFGLGKIADLPFWEVVGLFVLGDYWNYDPWYVFIHVVGVVLGLVGVVYVLWRSGRKGAVFDRRFVLLLFFGLVVVLVDYRVLKLFMVRVPFEEERLWVFRDLILLGFVAFVFGKFGGFVLGRVGRLKGLVLKFDVSKVEGLFLAVVVGGWVFSSVFYSAAYPYFSPLQTTWYEVDAVKYIDAKANQSYVVVGDQFFNLAGLVFVGVSNPRAYYFPLDDARGSRLFQDMVIEVSGGVLLRAMEVNNASLAFFVLQEARWSGQYDGVVAKATANGLATFKVFYDSDGVEKLRIWVYRRS